TATASGCQGLGMSEFMQGRFLEARKEFELGLVAANEQVSSEHCYPSMSLSYLAWTLFVLGNELEAEELAGRAIESARLESSHAVAAALCNCCYVYQCMGALDKVYGCTDQLVEHTRKYGEFIYLKRGIIIRGWADSVTNQSDEPIETINETIDFLLQSKELVEITFLLGVLTELQIEHERISDAKSSLRMALNIATGNQEVFYLAELYRLKAKLAEIDPASFLPVDGDDWLALARRTAEKQHAKAWLDRLERSSPALAI
ncbi:MAG: tetratricopeptide repeat protein, partial [Nitrososphaera sp.]|nr:tetratricopeptide repeat protein [Nitrososphaera sp.]